jgi:hypothetical protein
MMNWWQRACPALLLIGALLSLPLAAEAGDSCEGLPIVGIVVNRTNIFDTSQPETSAWPYRAANALHVVSRESFIRSMLLFEEGDLYSAAQAEESARILRSLGFINPVAINPRPVEGGVEVTVDTHDRWTLEVGAQLGMFGSRSNHSVTFKEDNFLGFGRQVKVEFESDNERDTWLFGYFDPNLLGKRWQTWLDYEDSSDGYRERVRIERPFYSLLTRRAWGLEWDNHEVMEHLYSESHTKVLGRGLTTSWRLWGGVRLDRGDDTTHRLVLGWENQNRRYQEWKTVPGQPAYPTPEKRKINGIRVGYQSIPDRFVVLEGFRAWSVQEDVSLGPNLDVGVVASLPAFGGDIERFLFDGRVSAATRRGNWLYLAKGWWSGRIDDGQARNVLAGVQVAASQLGRRGWQGRLRVETVVRPDRDVQLTLGADTGLRGWDPDYFDGTGRAVANVQWRTLIDDDVFHLLALGAVFFTDLGHTWGARVGSGTGRVHFDVGVGLLADLKQIGRSNLLRLDIALPDDGSGVVVSVTTSSLF